MAQLAVRIHDAVRSLLEDKEEIRAVGQLQTELPPVAGWFLTSYISSFWYVAITNRWVRFVKLTILSKPDFKKTYSVPLSDVHLEGDRLSRRTASPDLPQYFQLYFGLKRATGLDKDAFVQALAQGTAESTDVNVRAA
jgi:hypothetical protein